MVKQISDNEIYLLIKYIKSVLWRAAKCLSYIEDARSLMVNKCDPIGPVGLSLYYFLFPSSPPPIGPRRLYCRAFMITLRHSTIGSTSLDERSAGRRKICLTTHYAQKRQTSLPPVGFVPAIPKIKRPQNYDLDRAALGTGVTAL